MALTSGPRLPNRRCGRWSDCGNATAVPYLFRSRMWWPPCVATPGLCTGGSARCRPAPTIGEIVGTLVAGHGGYYDDATLLPMRSDACLSDGGDRGGHP